MIQAPDWLKEASLDGEGIVGRSSVARGAGGRDWSILSYGGSAFRGRSFLSNPLGGPCADARRPTADKRGGNVRSHRIDEHRDLILSWVEEKPDLTLAEVAERLDEAVG